MIKDGAWSVSLRSDVVADMSTFAESVRGSTELRKLKMIECHIDDSNSVVLMKAVGQSSSIRELNLTCNYLGIRSMKALGEALECSTTLEKVNLAFNSINDDHVEVLAKAIPKSRSLRELIVFGNKYECRGERALARAVAESRTLQVLQLTAPRYMCWECTDFLTDSVRKSRSTMRVDVNSRDQPEVNVSLAYARVARCFLAFHEGAEAGPVRKFLRRDGDHAIMIRVMRWLL